ncbi:MAG: divalent-cation tolerance protein CutA [Planctomycetota bacterium]
MSVEFVYITASDADEAGRIARAIVDERLAACANVIDGVRSIYWWQGEVQDDAEAVLIAKTRRELVPALIDRVVELHSYDCPCVVTLPIEAGHPPFLRWVEAETRPS